LSPIRRARRRSYAKLRADLGAPDVSDFVVVSDADLQTVLRELREYRSGARYTDHASDDRRL
jgi:predicted exporter